MFEYNIDIGKKSTSLDHTPGAQAKRLPFYVHGCGHFYAGKSYFTKREGLDNYLLIYTLSGSGYLKYKDDEYVLQPNQAVVFYCQEPQLYRTNSGIPWEFKWVHFNGVSAKVYYDMVNGQSLNVVSMKEDSAAGSLLDLISREIGTRDIMADVKVCSALTGIMTEIVTCMHSPLNNRRYNCHKTELDKALAFIHENYDKSISTDDIARLVLMSKFHFLRLFKSYTGSSPYEYVINYRVSMSKSLLKDSDLTISEISSHIGFSDANNFVRYFKRLVGTTPSNYRKYWIS